MSLEQDISAIKKLTEAGVMPYAEDENLIDMTARTGVTLRNKAVEPDKEDLEESEDIFKPASYEDMEARNLERRKVLRDRFKVGTELQTVQGGAKVTIIANNGDGVTLRWPNGEVTIWNLEDLEDLRRWDVLSMLRESEEIFKAASRAEQKARKAKLPIRVSYYVYSGDDGSNSTDQWFDTLPEAMRYARKLVKAGNGAVRVRREEYDESNPNLDDDGELIWCSEAKEPIFKAASPEEVANGGR